jgi:CTD nuclear envelope phosphatase 1
LLSFWTALVVETRAERSKRRKRIPTVLQQLTGDLGSEVEGEAEGEGSASEVEGGLASDDDWLDPVTRAPVDEKLDIPNDEEFGGAERKTDHLDEKFTFRLRSAEKKDPIPIHPTPPITPPPKPKTFVQQPTPPSILANPSPSPKREKSNRLLPNPIATAVLDPTVPAVPTPKVAPSPSPRRHTTPFHLQKTLILDLDETLIHSTSRPISYAASAGGGLLGLSFGGLVGGRTSRREGHTVEVILNGRSTTYHVYKRPHVDHFLKKVSHSTRRDRAVHKLAGKC